MLEEIDKIQQEIRKLDSILDKQIGYAISKEMQGLPFEHHYEMADRIANRIDAQKRLIEEIKRG